MPTSYPRSELLASTQWLAENLDRHGVRAVDCRWRPDGTAANLFRSGHVDGATQLDWASDLIDPDDAIPYQLAGPDAVARAAGRAGIGDGTVAVLYDDSAALFAARVWWSLRAYGFASARILDGGYRRWLAEGWPVAGGAAATTATTFTPRADLRVRLNATEVNALVGTVGLTIVDARAPAEYRGHGGTARRLGHIPGATNVPVTLLTVPETGEFRPAEDLQALMSSAALSPARRIVVYDDSGVGAAKLAFVLALLGYEDVALYDGGWTEWGNRLDLPVER